MNQTGDRIRKKEEKEYGESVLQGENRRGSGKKTGHRASDEVVHGGDGAGYCHSGDF